MRFTVEVSLKGDPPYLIQAEYRKCITLLIKEAFKSIEGGDEYYHKYWGNWRENNAKPFTFSLFIEKPRMVMLDSVPFLEFFENTMSLNFSSSDHGFLVLLYKGLLQINKKYSPFRHTIEFTNIYIKKDDYIEADTASFRIMSPIVVRDIMVMGNNKRFRGYLSVNDENFSEALNHSIRDLYKRFLPKAEKKIKKSDIILDISDCYGVRINHYSEVMPGTKGIIGIRADKEILKLIYDTGIGARRSQGFGMVEINKNNSTASQKSMALTTYG